MEAEHPITRFREERGLTMAQFGALLGVSKTSISRWESGERFPDRDIWPRIQELTGISVGDLFEAMPAREPAE